MTEACARCGSEPAVSAASTRATALCSTCADRPEVAAFLTEEARWRAREVQRARAARLRYEARAMRLQREAAQRDQLLAGKGDALSARSAAEDDPISAAIERARARLRKP